MLFSLPVLIGICPARQCVDVEQLQSAALVGRCCCCSVAELVTSQRLSPDVRLSGSRGKSGNRHRMWQPPPLWVCLAISRRPVSLLAGRHAGQAGQDAFQQRAGRLQSDGLGDVELQTLQAVPRGATVAERSSQVVLCTMVLLSAW